MKSDLSMQFQTLDTGINTIESLIINQSEKNTLDLTKVVDDMRDAVGNMVDSYNLQIQKDKKSEHVMKNLISMIKADVYFQSLTKAYKRT